MPISIGGFLFSIVLAQREGITDSTQLTQAGLLGAVLGFSPIGIIATAELVNQQAQNITPARPTLTVNGQAIFPTALTQFSGPVATVSDPAVTQPNQLSATIDWGDGSTSTGTVNGSGGNFNVSGSHTYIAAGNFPITINVTDTARGTSTGSATALVGAAPLTVNTQNMTISATAGVPFNGPVATVSDPAATQPNQLSATIDWGDGSTSSGIVSGANGSFSISGSHTYTAAGSFSITISVIDGTNGQTGTGQVTTTVNPPPVQVSVQIISALAGVPFTGQIATVSDPAATQPGQLSATIDWGDTSPTSSGTVSGADGNFSVTSNHTYTNTTPDSYTITVSVVDTATKQTGSGTGTATVNAPPIGQANGQVGLESAPATVMATSQEIVPSASSAVASPAKVRVPSLHGKTYADAREVLHSHGLQARRKNEEGEKDRVIRQEPHPETLVDAQSTVTLYIGNGKGKDFEGFEEFTHQE